jgi:hypothetical protein
MAEVGLEVWVGCVVVVVWAGVVVVVLVVVVVGSPPQPARTSIPTSIMPRTMSNTFRFTVIVPPF